MYGRAVCFRSKVLGWVGNVENFKSLQQPLFWQPYYPTSAYFSLSVAGGLWLISTTFDQTNPTNTILLVVLYFCTLRGQSFEVENLF